MVTLTLRDIRNPGCDLCKMHQTADVVCQMGMGPINADIVVVGKMPNSRDWQIELEEQLEEMGLGTSRVYFTQAVKCKTFDQDPSNGDIKTCSTTYLSQEFDRLKPKFVLALGNEALLAVTGRSGITKYRGRVFDDPRGFSCIATISPSAVKRNPGQRPGYMADLRLFVNKVFGIVGGIEPPKYMVVDTKDKLKKLERILQHTQAIYFDVETHSDYYKADGRIVTLSATCIVEMQPGKRTRFVFALPLYHPQSPWVKNHRSIIKFLAPALQRIPKVVAHNAPYDTKWLRWYGVDIMPTFDTMLAIHLLNENIQKGLKPTAQARLGVEPWGIDTRSLLDKPLDQILEYNVLDTWYMYWIERQLYDELMAQPRIARLFYKLIMPAMRELVRSEMRGIYIDVDKLKKARPIVEGKLAEIEAGIREHLPDPEDPWCGWPMQKKGKREIRREVNFNASIFARWFLFEHLGLPVAARGKLKPDGSPGDPSMAEDVLMALRDMHPAVEGMLARVEWNKYLTAFINPYEELYDDDHRIHTNFKLAGTVTGRLSSGKNDPDKVSAGKGKLRGVNLQQVPRNPLIRGLFGAPPGWSFIESDYSQIELRIAAFLARERTMLHLYSIGADIHLTTAAKVTGKPESQVTKEERKKVGKPVNFGFLYGMGWRKFIQTAFSNYGAVFDENEARAYREAYFALYNDLPRWHQKQRRLVREYGRVQSPLGRVRHLPDIYSPEEGVRAEAERQAINSPVQSMASDMAVLSMVVINQRFREMGIVGHCLGLVHDAVNYEIRDDHVARALPVIKDTMEDMSIVRRKFGVNVDIPIVADLKVGTHWGDARELEVAEVYDYRGEPD